MSSAIIPQPSGSDSAFLIKRGLMISKKRNKRNAANTYFTFTGRKIILTHIPATSSITTFEGSFPHSGTIADEEMTPPAMTKKVIGIASASGG